MRGWQLAGKASYCPRLRLAVSIPRNLVADSDEDDHLFRRRRPLVGAKRRAEARGW
jgi:hypothetical protein